jgi:hypothetical protein
MADRGDQSEAAAVAALEKSLASRGVYQPLRRNERGEVEVFDVYDAEIADKRELDRLRELPHLKKVSLSNVRCREEHLEVLGQLTGLEDLDLRGMKQVTRRTVEWFANLPNLKRLLLIRVGLDDDATRSMATMSSLRTLCLLDLPITSQGVCQLVALSGLETLSLGNTSIDDQALEHVARLKNLCRLEIAETQLSGAGFQFFNKAGPLSSLSAPKSAIDDTGLFHLAQIRSLEDLNLDYSRVTDVGILHFSGHQRLKSFKLLGCHVTDASADVFCKIRSLRSLDVEDTPFTKTGRRVLKKKLPKCYVFLKTMPWPGEPDDQLGDQVGEPVSPRDDPEYLWQHVPRCIQDFTLRRLHKNEQSKTSTTFELQCACGGKLAQVIGHPLSRLNRQVPDSLLFVGPLGFRCERCKKTTEILDTKLHGYHGELNASATYRGNGRRTAFRCPKCSQNLFAAVRASFHYGDAAFDLWEDDNEVALSDYFQGFGLHARCANCQAQSAITQLDL